MKKRVWLAVILILLSVVNSVVFNVIGDQFEEPFYNSWIDLSSYMIVLYAVFAVLLPDKLQPIKFIPSLVIVGYYVTYFVGYQTDPELSNPFGYASMVYTAAFSILLMSLVDLLKNDYQGFKIFVAMMLFGLNTYGVINTFSYKSDDFTGTFQTVLQDVTMTLLVFQLPFVIFFLETFYQKVTRKRREEIERIKASIEIPYNRYRLEQKPNQIANISVEAKTLAQLQREKNALKGITNLYEAGLLSEEEFERKKKRILSGK